MTVWYVFAYPNPGRRFLHGAALFSKLNCFSRARFLSDCVSMLACGWKRLRCRSSLISRHRRRAKPEISAEFALFPPLRALFFSRVYLWHLIDPIHWITGTRPLKTFMHPQSLHDQFYLLQFSVYYGFSTHEFHNLKATSKSCRKTTSSRFIALAQTKPTKLLFLTESCFTNYNRVSQWKSIYLFSSLVRIMRFWSTNYKHDFKANCDERKLDSIFLVWQILKLSVIVVSE